MYVALCQALTLVSGTTFSIRHYLQYQALPSISGSTFCVRHYLQCQALPSVSGTSFCVRHYLQYQALPSMSGTTFCVRHYILRHALPSFCVTHCLRAVSAFTFILCQAPPSLCQPLPSLCARLYLHSVSGTTVTVSLCLHSVPDFTSYHFALGCSKKSDTRTTDTY